MDHFSKIQTFIVDVAKNASLVALYSTFVEFLDHILSQLKKGPSSKDLQLNVSLNYASFLKIDTNKGNPNS